MKRSKPGDGANPFLSKVLPDREHRCAAVHFAKGSPVDASPISCICGWEGALAQWPAHAPRLGVAASRKDGEFVGAQHSIPDTRLMI